jgi:protein-S-isoprenylcysteine O-methyltransferase Ste14
MTEWLDLCGWIACVVYSTIPGFWLLIHPLADYWRARKRSPYLFLVPLWLAMWIILGLLTSPWRHDAFYRTPWTWLPAVLLLSTSFWIYSRSGKHFSQAQLSGLPEVSPSHHEQRLVTWGIRSRVRHPIYLAHLCGMLAWSVGTGLAVCYALTALAMITGTIMIRLEEAELEQRFGEEYRAYREKIPAVLPSF